jgi:glutamine synthetase
VTALETKADAEALINKEGIEYVSVRFTDLIGVQQHFTVPASMKRLFEWMAAISLFLWLVGW